MNDDVDNSDDLPTRSRFRFGWKTILLGVVGISLISAVFVSVAEPKELPPATYVGRQSCVECHQNEHGKWLHSHHDLAMQAVTEKTVLGNFKNVTFTHPKGLASRFFRDGKKFMVNTEGPDGKLHDYEIAYVFGVEPLQQYLVKFPKGRYQALKIAWDTKKKQWYSLSPNERIAADDWMHWSQRGFNWNSNCADCHSTNLQKNYDHKTDSYQTTYSEMNVSCEACHGPGSRHVDWANSSVITRAIYGYDNETKELVHSLKDPGRKWGLDDKGNPKLVGTSGIGPDPQVETCARCHSLRGPITKRDKTGDPLLDHWMPGILRGGQYHADGQIDGEVYVHGSFMQSKMYHSGVRCSDCHDPHTTKLRETGNALCFQCHVSTRYNTPKHHHHKMGSSGAKCVECHMPSKIYMGVDARRDHSLRIPRPDLSLVTGSPNACNQCHQKKKETVQWAADAAVKWYGAKYQAIPHWGPSIAKVRNGDPNSKKLLLEVIANKKWPAIVRATALAEISGVIRGDTDPKIVIAALKDSSSLVRYGAIGAVMESGVSSEKRGRLLEPLLDDSVRAVRHRAAVAITVLRHPLKSEEKRQLQQRLLDEREEGLLAHSDNRSGRLVLGEFYRMLATGATGEKKAAFEKKMLAEYRVAAKMDSRHIGASMALVRGLIPAGQTAEAITILRRLIQLPRPIDVSKEQWDVELGDVYFQLGLSLAGDKKHREEGVRYLKEAVRRRKGDPRIHFNLGVVYGQMGKWNFAESHLLRADKLSPNDSRYLLALSSIFHNAKRLSKAVYYAKKLVERFPENGQFRGHYFRLKKLFDQERARSP